MGVNSLPKTVIRQHRDCDLNPGPTAPESSTLTTRLPSHPIGTKAKFSRLTVVQNAAADFHQILGSGLLDTDAHSQTNRCI